MAERRFADKSCAFGVGARESKGRWRRQGDTDGETAASANSAKRCRFATLPKGILPCRLQTLTIVALLQHLSVLRSGWGRRTQHDPARATLTKRAVAFETIMQVNNPARTTFWQPEYEPFGDIWPMRVGSAADQPLRFPGQERGFDWEGSGASIVAEWFARVATEDLTDVRHYFE